eukprot:GHVT01045970.1.p1 GENE.GHVT01045970.1~~GHVT01045970.1.p1  ORF type:complete len:303 (+),score=60.22 GHVT01045970.1:609-1517(+)
MAPMPGGIRLGEFIPGVFKGRPRGGGGDEASSSASSSTRARTKKPELDELLAKVQAIQNECEEQDKIVRRDENLREVRDPFLKTKGQIYAKIEEARERIKLRNDTVRDKGGGCHASIRLRHQIEDLLIRLRADFKQLCDIYAQQYRSRMRLRLKEDELEKRYQDLNVIKRGIRETQEAFKDTRDFSQNQIKTLTDLQTEHNQRIATAAIEAGIGKATEKKALVDIYGRQIIMFPAASSTLFNPYIHSVLPPPSLTLFLLHNSLPSLLFSSFPCSAFNAWGLEKFVCLFFNNCLNDCFNNCIK